MFCSHCGSEIPTIATYCSGCGKPVGGQALTPSPGRIAGHVRLLGIFWLALSVLRLFPGAVLLLIAKSRPRLFPLEVPGFVSGVLAMIALFIFVTAIAGILTGWGLLNREPWGRVLALVMAMVNLMEVPFGTALGIYTLWVLLPAQSEREYRQTSRQTIADART